MYTYLDSGKTYNLLLRPQAEILCGATLPLFGKHKLVQEHYFHFIIFHTICVKIVPLSLFTMSNFEIIIHKKRKEQQKDRLNK